MSDDADVDNIKKEIQKLINEFKSKREFYLGHSEGTTELHLIYGLFEILGWHRTDFIPQQKARRDGKPGRVDYSLKLGEKDVLFIEVKKVGISLEKEADKQVRSYASSKQISFAVSTNFETMNVFCVEEKDKDKRIMFKFKSPDEYIEKIYNLLLLSKKGFEECRLEKEAVDRNLLKQRISINESLLTDLMKIRNLISNSIEEKYPGKFTAEQKDEIVQRIIDRLVFMRKAEDTGISPNTRHLKELSEYPEEKCYSELKKMFVDYHGSFNSGLFDIGKDNDCDSINIDGKIIKKLIKSLYDSDDGEFIYDFEKIDADILGQVYEQYLGHILEQKKSGKTKLIQIDKKEKGIYYTPTYIVKYIVDNTIGELSKTKKVKLSEISILDPACGSGSFLIKAFDYFEKILASKEDVAQYKLDEQASYSHKTGILKKNVYGVDIDQKAVEITKLNLLLKSAEKNRKLPEEAELHIRHGNSIIDDESIDKANYFMWERKFNDILKLDEHGNLKDGYGFDVIIGNPPYVFARSQMFSQEEKDYYYKTYKLQTYQLNTYGIFVEKAFKLLKKGGFLGFIVPNNWLTVDTFSTFRKFILENCSDIQIINIYDKVFQEANVDVCILILRKNKPDKISLFEMRDGKLETIGTFNASVFLKDKNIINISMFKNKNNSGLIQKIEKNSTNLREVAQVSTGLKAYQIGKGKPKQTKEVKENRKFHSKEKLSSEYYPYLEGRDVKRYALTWSGEYLHYGDHLAEPRKSVPFKGVRILVRQIPSKPPYCINAAIVDQQILHDINSMVIFDFQKDYTDKLILGILNSKLITYWFLNKFGKLQRNLFPQFKVNELKIFPFPKKIIPKQKEKIEGYVDKLCHVIKQVSAFKDSHNSERSRLEEELNELNREIDDLVYELYDLNNTEKKLIEDSLK